MIKVVFLDLDETLVAQELAFERAYGATARLAAAVAGIDAGSFGAAIPAAANACLDDLPVAEFVRRCRFGARDVLWGDTGVGVSETAASESLRALGKQVMEYRRAVWSSLLERFGAGHTDLCGRLDECFRREMEGGVEVFPDVAGALERLSARYRLAVITNGLPLAQRRKLERLGMAHYFEELVASAEVGVGKPDPEIFHCALRRMRVAAEDALMVGDSLEGDVLGAQGVGMRAILVRRRNHIGTGPEADARVVADLEELEAVLDLDSRSSAL